MSVIPEAVLQKAITGGYRALRKDSRLIDTIFKSLNQDQVAQIKDFVLNTAVNFTINYPRKDVVLPVIALVLKNESESQTFLGDMLGDASDPWTPDPALSVDTLGGHSASVTDQGGLFRKFAGPIQVTLQESPTRISFADQLDLTDRVQRANLTGAAVHVVGGTGAGQVLEVRRMSNTSLDTIEAFGVPLDSTSLIDIRVLADPETPIGEPSRVYEKTYGTVRKGVNYEANYYLHILSGQQEQTIFLYSLVKAILLTQRKFLESQGIQSLKISGTDFAPRSDFLPDEAFQRVMTLTFSHPFTFIEEQEVFTNISIDLVNCPTDSLLQTITFSVDD